MTTENVPTDAELKNLRKGLTFDGYEQSPAITPAPTKHDPHCDCGICAYCNGQEDIYGNTRHQPPAVPSLREHNKYVAAFLSEMAEIYSLDVALGDEMSITTVCDELLKVSRDIRERLGAVKPTREVGEAIEHIERVVHDSDMKRNRRRLWEGAQYVLALLETIRDNKTTNAATGAQTCVKCPHKPHVGRCQIPVREDDGEDVIEGLCGCEFPAATTAAERPRCCSLAIAIQDNPIFEGKELVCGTCGRTWFYHNVGGWKLIPVPPAATPSISEAIACVEKLRDEWVIVPNGVSAESNTRALRLAKVTAANEIIIRLRTLQPSTPSELVDHKETDHAQ